VENNKSESNIFYPPGGILLWIIIFIELITFGMAVIAFVLSTKQEPELFHESRLQLNATIGTINTIVLITSGYFMAKAVKLYKTNNQKKSSLFIKLTIVGGLVFTALKSIEYYLKIKNNLLADTNTFYTFYWFLTLFHLVHVIVGLIILTIANYNIKNKPQTTSPEDLEASAAFWHMCDLIWLIIFPILYLYN